MGVSDTRVVQAAHDRNAEAYAEAIDITLDGAVARMAEHAGAASGVTLRDVATGTGICARAARRGGAALT